MNSKRHLYFRWTPRTAGISLMYIVVVPSIIGYIAYKSDVSGTSLGSLLQTLMDAWMLMWSRALSISRRRGRAIRSLSDRGMRGRRGRLYVYMRLENYNSSLDPKGYL